MKIIFRIAIAILKDKIPTELCWVYNLVTYTNYKAQGLSFQLQWSFVRVPPISPACPQPFLELWALGAGADQEQVDGPSAGGEEAEGGSAGHYISSWPAPVQAVARRGARGEDEEEDNEDNNDSKRQRQA